MIADVHVRPYDGSVAVRYLCETCLGDGENGGRGYYLIGYLTTARYRRTTGVCLSCGGTGLDRIEMLMGEWEIE